MLGILDPLVDIVDDINLNYLVEWLKLTKGSNFE
jgi:hypothetical protein